MRISIIICALFVLFLCFLSGCRTSDVITGIFSRPQFLIPLEAASLETAEAAEELPEEPEDLFPSDDGMPVWYQEILERREEAVEHTETEPNEKEAFEIPAEPVVSVYNVQEQATPEETETEYETVIPDIVETEDQQVVVSAERPDISKFTEEETEPGDSGTTEASVAADQSDNYDEPGLSQTNVTDNKIDLLFISGQSNAVGLTDQWDGYTQARMESVVCPADQVYSSFLPLDQYASGVVGIDNIGGLITKDDVSRYISDSVGSKTSLAGTELLYKPYALSDNGSGKTGMDGAIAYKWNQMTGRKVWVINVAYSGSQVWTWVPGQSNYEILAETVKDVIQVVNNDPDYEIGRIRMFWLQGESDTFTEQSTYESQFKSLIDGLDSIVNDLKTGIIIPRAMGGNTNPFDSTPAQAALRNVASKYGNVAVVSDVNLTWTSDAAVRNYFYSVYPNGITYPIHSGTYLSVPSTYAETYVHPHYTQAGHNENGLTAATAMFNIFG